MPRRNGATAELDRVSMKTGIKNRSHTKRSRSKAGKKRIEYLEESEKTLRKKYIQAERYQVVQYLYLVQLCCPITGHLLMGKAHPHHVLFRRHPDAPWLYHKCNIALVCPEHHSPEAHDLGYWCILQKLQLKICTIEEFEEYFDYVNGKEKSGVHIPVFYYRARDDYRAQLVKGELERRKQSGHCDTL